MTPKISRRICLCFLLSTQIPFLSQINAQKENVGSKEIGLLPITVPCPKNQYIVLGVGYDDRKGKFTGTQVIKPDTKLTPTGAGSEITFSISLSDREIQTALAQQAEIDVRTRSVMWSAHINGRVEKQRSSLEQKASLRLLYYVESPNYQIFETDSSHSEFINFELLKRQFESHLADGTMDKFYEVYGTHVLVGFKLACGVSAEASFQSEVDRLRLYMSALASGSYGPVEGAAQADSLLVRRDANSSFHLNYRKWNIDNKPLPNLPGASPNFHPTNVLAEIQSYLAQSFQNAHWKYDSHDGDANSIGAPVLGFCKPYSAIFGKTVPSIYPEPSSILTKLVQAYDNSDAYLDSLRELQQLDGQFRFLAGQVRSNLNRAIDLTLTNKYQCESWICQMATNSNVQLQHDIESEFSHQSLSWVELPRIQLYPNVDASADGSGIFVTLRVSKGPFVVRSYRVGATEPERAAYNVFGPETNDKDWYIARNHGNSEAVDDGEFRDVVFCIMKHGGNPAAYKGKFRLDLVLDSNVSKSPISSVIANFH